MSFQLTLKVKSPPQGRMYPVVFGREGGFQFSFLVLIELDKRRLVWVFLDHQLLTEAKEPS